MSVRDIIQGSLKTVDLPIIPSCNLYMWGQNSFGEIGNGTSATVMTPTQVGSLTNWCKIATSTLHTLAIKTDGTLWAWGCNIAGQLGNNTTTSTSSPVQVGGLTGWCDISVAYSASYAIRTNGTLWSWGCNVGGFLGLNDRVNRSSPVQIGSATDWKNISGGGLGTTTGAAIKTNNTLWVWGCNSDGNLGQNDRVARSSPVQVGSLSDWAQVSVGDRYLAAIKTNGTTWSWGYNFFGQVGDGTTTARSSPIQVGCLTSDWAQVDAGYNIPLRIKTNGTLWTGSNTQQGTDSDWCGISSGYLHWLAIKTNGTLWAWGCGSCGRLGTGTFTNQCPSAASGPVQVGTSSDWAQVAAAARYSGGQHSLGIKTNNTLWAWGGGGFGRGAPLGLTIGWGCISPIQIGGSEWADIAVGGGGHVIAMKSNRTIWSWGRNGSGLHLLGRGCLDDTIYPVPTQIGTQSNWAQVSAGVRNGFAIKANNSLWMWGCWVGGGTAFIDASTPIQIGSSYSCVSSSKYSVNTFAIKTDCSLWAWGCNNFGMLGQNNLNFVTTPSQVGSLTDWAKICPGNAHTLAIKTNGTLWAWGGGAGGHLGLNDIVNRSSPVQVGSLSDWAQISVGSCHSLAIKTNGTLWAWGCNQGAQLGTNDTISKSSPVQVGSLTDWANVFAATAASYAVKTNGTIWAWGGGNAGAWCLGLSIPAEALCNLSSPVQIGSLTNWKAGDAGDTSGAFR